jgi:hypothetical protein
MSSSDLVQHDTFVVAGIHFGEKFSEEFIHEQRLDPLQYVDIETNPFPEARAQSLRNLDDNAYYGNLNAQCGEAPYMPMGARTDTMSQQDWETLQMTRWTARKLITRAQSYRSVIDVHGGGRHYGEESLVLLNRTLGHGALCLTETLAFKKAVIAWDPSLVGRVSGSIQLEMTDYDIGRVSEVRQAIDELGAHVLPSPSVSYLRSVQWYEWGANVASGKMAEELGLCKDVYEPFEPLPMSVSDRLGLSDRLYVMAWDPVHRVAELAVSRSFHRVFSEAKGLPAPRDVTKLLTQYACR